MAGKSDWKAVEMGMIKTIRVAQVHACTKIVPPYNFGAAGKFTRVRGAGRPEPAYRQSLNAALIASRSSFLSALRFLMFNFVRYIPVPSVGNNWGYASLLTYTHKVFASITRDYSKLPVN